MDILTRILIVNRQLTRINELKESYLRLQQANEFLKKSNEDKQSIITNLQEHTKWLEKLINKNNGIE